MEKLRHDVWFCWCGAPDDTYTARMAAQRKRLSLLVEPGNVDDLLHLWYQAANFFLLPSREDTFPLVCLEAASWGLPIVYFADTGGMPSFVGEDAGMVVPFLDRRHDRSVIGKKQAERATLLYEEAKRIHATLLDVYPLPPNVREKMKHFETHLFHQIKG